jgi:predicted lipase
MPWLDRDDELVRTARDREWLAKLAYEDDAERLRTSLADRFALLEALPLSLGFVAASDQEVVVAFAGTRDGIDWFFNVVHPLAPGYGGRVHKGFAHLADHIGESVTRTVKKMRTSRHRVALTGHSRGGALAMLTAYRLHAAGVPQAHAFTFGAPRVGDATFARAYDPPLYRFEASHDPVPSLPALQGYEEVGERFLLTQDGRVYRNDGTWVDNLMVLHQAIRGPTSPDSFTCHRIDHYLQQLGG